MTEPSDTPREADEVDYDQIYEDSAPEADQVIEPEDDGPAPLAPADPVTAHNPDPAAQSEHARNQAAAAEYHRSAGLTGDVTDA